MPQDTGLRLQVVHQHLQDGNAAAARKLFAPAAYNPHSPPAWRDWSSKVIARLAANDAKGALAIWDSRGATEAAGE